ncbi:hypothetical protein BDD21_1009 [Thiocapsa rosea]|uniref:Uncharacterized protein n=1 Tax=Thiocapsa rosea TaxID=69360 RepID=A0A495V4Y3_9GAMM|nr:hypothetical protein BDD21_1009 [Thiocapsa rosea]
MPQQQEAHRLSLTRLIRWILQPQGLDVPARLTHLSGILECVPLLAWRAFRLFFTLRNLPSSRRRRADSYGRFWSSRVIHRAADRNRDHARTNRNPGNAIDHGSLWISPRYSERGSRKHRSRRWKVPRNIAEDRIGRMGVSCLCGFRRLLRCGCAGHVESGRRPSSIEIPGPFRASEPDIRRLGGYNPNDCRHQWPHPRTASLPRCTRLHGRQSCMQ